MKYIKFIPIFLILVITSKEALAFIDLGVGFDKKTDRPNSFIAWRNTQRILETEVEIKNYGDQQAFGRMSIAILDEYGNVLLEHDDTSMIVALPAANDGGLEGKIVQLKGSLAMNALLDRLDRLNKIYAIRATIVAEGTDVNLDNNVATKYYNTRSAVQPAATAFQEFSFRNNTESNLRLQWKEETSGLPAGWKVKFPEIPNTSVLGRGQVFNSYISLMTPSEIREGAHADIRIEAVDMKSGNPVYQYEWFAVYDTTAPKVTGNAFEVDANTGSVTFNLTAVDNESMLKEASGVQIEYSTDGGLTFSSRTMQYLDGNFVGPTRFRAKIGPFASGTKLKVDAVAQDIAGNVIREDFPDITISRVAQ